MKNLFDSTKVNGLELKNRFIRAAVWMKMAEEDGHLNPEIMKIYEDLAEGGVGLILTGYAFISEDEQPNPRMLGIYDDSFIDEYREMVRRVHEKGSKIALQIAYGGSQSHHPKAHEMNILAPSSVENRVTELTPKEATKEDIKEIIGKFADAAERAKKAGFDAVQIHGAHGYFLSSFLTPFYNRRNDEYGGSIENRSRIILETVKAVRERVGEDYPLMIKLNFSDFMDEGEGLTEDEAMWVFSEVDKLGIDMIEVSACNESSGKGHMPARTKIASIENQSYFKDVTKKIAEKVNAKVILMGGNRNIDSMEEILKSSKIEYFSVGRPLLCEPNLIDIWSDDSKYRPKCVSCNKCWETEPNSCIFNRNNKA